MDLILGLPEDIARECLIRISYQQFPTVASVCKGWKTEIESPVFRRQRRSTGHAQKILIMVQTRTEPEKSRTGSTKPMSNLVYFLSVFEPETGKWSELPPPPGFESGLPMFCQLAGIGPDLVLIGGLDRISWNASNSVFIYNMLTAEWRCGSHMPGVGRSFFGCVSDPQGIVFVAGGHDDDKNALKSVLAYDVMSDLWVSLPNMTSEHDECKAMFRGGRLYVVGGYPTESQGQFGRSAEVFDFATWQWSTLEGFLDCATCLLTLVDDYGDGDERIYICSDGGLMTTIKDFAGQKIATLPPEIRHVAHIKAFDGAILVIGSSGYGEEHMSFVFDVKSDNGWRKLDNPRGFRGHVQTSWVFKI
ncbi:hypothetical protein TanjilG_27286 [Lupinus angustifolius]|uniref:F-box domain-containing protein n=1 Tax=Lupinus angustifolius TaxID=3871 RepID=A0A1J7IEQ3_LUPAN|nr:PREDICTED: F-box/kelch-repeat protein At1g80440-like [Lupinus angustifolius]OIW17132.1 hypothetical protein TanjilG_27286 [Lupinus angustifolius]